MRSEARLAADLANVLLGGVCFVDLIFVPFPVTMSPKPSVTQTPQTVSRALTGNSRSSRGPARRRNRNPGARRRDLARGASDRSVRRPLLRHGAGHYIRIGDGPYSVTGGWPSVYAVHGGGEFCGLPPSGKPVFMRVMDFHLHHEGLIRENWVPLDMLDLLAQMGFDALARMREVLRR
jgi:hypothetical protein